MKWCGAQSQPENLLKACAPGGERGAVPTCLGLPQYLSFSDSILLDTKCVGFSPHNNQFSDSPDITVAYHLSQF